MAKGNPNQLWTILLTFRVEETEGYQGSGCLGELWTHGLWFCRVRKAEKWTRKLQESQAVTWGNIGGCILARAQVPKCT